MKRFRIGPEPIDVREIEAVVRGDARGALVTFCGIVRERADDGRQVSGLTYEAHSEMALAEFAAIAAEAVTLFGDCAVAVAHRTGDLQIGETAVAVAAASVHRSVAFDVCRYAIDQLKARAPIWKKERYVDGGAAWKTNDCGERA
jgi:molybdopterin synthase catalytic subunit